MRKLMVFASGAFALGTVCLLTFRVRAISAPAGTAATPPTTEAFHATTRQAATTQGTTRRTTTVFEGELTKLTDSSIAVLPNGTNSTARIFSLDDETRYGFSGAAEHKAADGHKVRNIQSTNATFGDLKVGQRVLVIPGKPPTVARYVGIMRYENADGTPKN